MNKVEHVVFEEFIKDCLMETHEINSEKVHVLPHQLNENILKDNYQKYACVGLSNSNDENIISEIVKKENQEKILKKAKCKVILKSKVINFDDGFLKVLNNYLDDMPFPSTFKYRMSGTLVDAFSNNKIILCSNITLMDYYSKEYPSICKIIESVDDFFEYVIKINKLEINEQLNEFEIFKNSHSEDKIVLVFKNMV
ncbi:hypothetical protein Q2T46_10640 [Thermoanaerobacterium sp. CMT5567-10]|uniref:hypothetical protein n=1 Tax=Thermoanaerobacterium sp. CMT5567-10 TaxID=3061989 RepID=UPI0026DFA174|nr:hypothetical protein [Thermoanaerobacterium sp. CMT5567-10]WKV08000.1 hypothetical protein Q2T46_10640 [Thermoanaerobacterium sp. CMT5567-10]